MKLVFWGANTWKYHLKLLIRKPGRSSLLIENPLDNKTLYINYKHCLILYTVQYPWIPHPAIVSLGLWNTILNLYAFSPRAFKKQKSHRFWARSGRRGNYRSGISLSSLITENLKHLHMWKEVVTEGRFLGKKTLSTRDAACVLL